MVDRAEVLSRVDLVALAEEVLGPGKGQGRSRMWPCPSPNHAQSGRTPPLSIFATRSGGQRFFCHGCGAAGTAVDLVMLTQGLDVHHALEALARRVALTPVTPRLAEPVALSPAWGMTSYLRRCASLLRTEVGVPARAWLGERAIPERVWDQLGLGFDPGAKELARMRGLPRAGPALTVPLPSPGRPYLVARYLDPEAAGLRWAHPTARHWGPAPPAVPLGPIRRGAPVVVLTEGVSDGLAALAVGWPAVAALGASRRPTEIASVVERWYPRSVVLVAGDGDDAGRRFSDSMLQSLQRGRLLSIPAGRDLGELVRRDLAGTARWVERRLRPLSQGLSMSG